MLTENIKYQARINPKLRSFCPRSKNRKMRTLASSSKKLAPTVAYSMDTKIENRVYCTNCSPTQIFYTTVQ